MAKRQGIEVSSVDRRFDEGGVEWRDIPDAPGYSASNDGRILGPRGSLKPTAMKNGYLGIKLCGKGTTVHAAVAKAFHGPRPSTRHTVNHKNGSKTDNRPENLEWVTHTENMRHAREVLKLKIGRQRKPRPTDLPELRMRITVERFDFGTEAHVFELRRTRRVDVYAVSIDGKPWACAGLSVVLAGLRKACPRVASPRTIA